MFGVRIGACGALPSLPHRQVQRLRRGPFDGQSNHMILKEVAKYMRENMTPSNALFELLYEDLVKESEYLSKRPGCGTDEHMSVSWAFVCDELRKQTMGPESKIPRWFAWEVNFKPACKHRFQDLVAWRGWRGRQAADPGRGAQCGRRGRERRR